MSLIPKHEKPTGARPQIIDGITFRCYRTGIMRYEWISDDGQIGVTSTITHQGTQYYCARTFKGGYVESKREGRARRFRTQQAALVAAVKAASRPDSGGAE